MTDNKEETSCCQMEAVVTVDPRGQIVLPKELRIRAGIEESDKLMVVSCKEEGKVCCITLMKVEESNAMIKEMMGPMLKGIFKEDQK